QQIQQIALLDIELVKRRRIRRGNLQYPVKGGLGDDPERKQIADDIAAFLYLASLSGSHVVERHQIGADQHFVDTHGGSQSRPGLAPSRPVPNLREPPEIAWARAPSSSCSAERAGINLSSDQEWRLIRSWRSVPAWPKGCPC